MTITNSASKNGYVALAPTPTDSVLPHSTGDPGTPTGAVYLANDNSFEVGEKKSIWRAYLGKVKGAVESNIGLLFVTASMAFFAMMDAAVKRLHNIDPPVSTLQLVAVRMGITYICCVIYMFATSVPDPFLGPKGIRLLLAFRGLAGFFSLFGMYYSLQFLSLSDATVITFLVPFCTGIAGALFLKENFTKKQAFASLLSFGGVILIARPVFLFGDESYKLQSDSNGISPVLSEKGTPTERLVAVGLGWLLWYTYRVLIFFSSAGLIGVCGATGAYTSLRAIGKRAHTLHSIMSFSIACLLISGPAMLATNTPFVMPSKSEWLALFFMMGIFGFFAQVFLAMGLQRETAGRGSMAAYTQIIFATIIERIFFKTVPSTLSVIGTLVIMSSALYVAVTKEQPQKTETSAMSLGTIREDSLEEGLLERIRHEDVSNHLPLRT
ncbi:EamA-like transporter family-domain-containing protein [Collybia nuda]|uniref:EamA-like transporter family-domain-containing protein n=1 Tax=Collybia nuda TaxID=64659 RepID=A0A9P5YFF9_9AGAR|nr:EamA-like transporter family-domain-containing protein [Collybia nuda]